MWLEDCAREGWKRHPFFEERKKRYSGRPDPALLLFRLRSTNWRRGHAQNALARQLV